MTSVCCRTVGVRAVISDPGLSSGGCLHLWAEGHCCGTNSKHAWSAVYRPDQSYINQRQGETRKQMQIQRNLLAVSWITQDSNQTSLELFSSFWDMMKINKILKNIHTRPPILIIMIINVHCLCPQAHIVFKPNIQQQRKCDNCTDSAIDGVFTVKYDVTRDSNAGELQVWHTHPRVQFKASLANSFHSWKLLPPGLGWPLRPVLRSLQPLASSKKHRVRHWRQRIHVGR